MKKLESRRGRGWKRRSAASTCQKVHRMGLGPPGSPLDEPINVNSGIGNIGNMGKNPNLCSDRNHLGIFMSFTF